MNSDLKKTFLSLVRLGIGHYSEALPSNVDWNELKDLAEKQGLSAIVLDGIERLKSLNVQGVQGVQEPPKVFLLEWIGETLQGFEYRYDQYCKAIAEMAALYNAHGLKMMVLKGFTCSLDWPKPEHRPCGDIDIWQFGRYREGDNLVASEKGIEIDSSHHHHTVFYWGEFMVENHYDFINVHSRKANTRIEKIYKELGSEANLNENDRSALPLGLSKNHNLEIAKGCKIESVLVEGERVYLPSPNLHALFLMRHLVSHFVGACISLRQVLDWAFFVEKHGKDVDWEWLDGVLEEFGMKEFYNIINAICVEDLGFDTTLFHSVRFNPQTKEKVFNDILCPAFGGEAPNSLLPRVIYKYKRWKGNGWKYALCYKESRWESVWTLLRSHLIKPTV